MQPKYLLWGSGQLSWGLDREGVGGRREEGEERGKREKRGGEWRKGVGKEGREEKKGEE